MNTALIGYLSPKGLFTPCRSFSHMETATKIVEREYPKEVKKSDFLNSELLMEEKHYVLFPLSGCTFYGKLLTDEQRVFIEDHLGDANNDKQKCIMMQLLENDADRREGRILSDYQKGF